MRRILDKNYITNGIVYAGAAHIASFINILVNVYGFSITHVAKSKISDIKKLESEIKKMKPYFKDRPKTMDLLNVFGTNQCSDISSFPNNFL